MKKHAGQALRHLMHARSRSSLLRGSSVFSTAPRLLCLEATFA
jgi:hypothetical protein